MFRVIIYIYIYAKLRDCIGAQGFVQLQPNPLSQSMRLYLCWDASRELNETASVSSVGVDRTGALDNATAAHFMP